MWDKRYDTDEYVYGTEANDFLKQQVGELPKGELLSLAEGEGRNAVFLAELGFDVTAVDSSRVGLEKAQRLAQQRGVSVNFIHADLERFEIGESCWDAIISVFCPLSPEARLSMHSKVVAGLKPAGVFLLEAYTPEQINFGTGGGKDPSVMQTPDSLRSELSGLHFDLLQATERSVVEGIFHTGKASVVQAVAIKPD